MFCILSVITPSTYSQWYTIPIPESGSIPESVSFLLESESEPGIKKTMAGINRLESESESESRVYGWNRNGISEFFAGIGIGTGIRLLVFPGIGIGSGIKMYPKSCITAYSTFGTFEGTPNRRTDSRPLSTMG